MSKGPLRTLLLISVVLVLPTCYSSVEPFAPAVDKCGSDGAGNAERHRPVVCVGTTADGKVTAHPPTIEAWDTLPNSNAKGVIHWITRGGQGDLQIRMKKDGCITTPVCRNGHCRATTIEVSEEEKTRQCGYSIFLNDVELDPDVIIVDCCAG